MTNSYRNTPSSTYVVGAADRERFENSTGTRGRVYEEAQVISWLKANPQGGMKFDGGKTKWSLLMRGCFKGLHQVVNVLNFGAKKYAANSWQAVEAERYEEALLRHVMAIMEHGPLHVDADSGLLSISHLACDSLFLCHFAQVEVERQAREATR